MAQTDSTGNKNTCRTRLGKLMPGLITIKRSAVTEIENPEQLQIGDQGPADTDYPADLLPLGGPREDGEPAHIQVYVGQAV